MTANLESGGKRQITPDKQYMDVAGIWVVVVRLSGYDGDLLQFSRQSVPSAIMIVNLLVIDSGAVHEC